MSTYGDHTDFRIIKNTVQVEGKDEPDEYKVYGSDEIFVQIPEGTEYQTTIHFVVFKPLKEFTYVLTAVKAGVTVKKTVTVLGDFEPREEPYQFECPKDKTPSGFFFRGKASMTSTYQLAGETVLQNNWIIEVTKK